MRKIDPSQAWTYRDVSRLEKRCPNGYHKDENGVCRRVEELEGEHPDLRHRTPESYERGKRQHEAEQAEGKSPKVGEVLDSNSKVARDIRSAFTTSDDAEQKAKARKAREDLMEYLRNHDNVPPLTKAKSFVMKYDAEKKEYVRAEKMEEGAFAFDGHTSTRDAYTTEDGSYTPERLEFHARILDSIINGYTNRKGEKVPPMSKPPEGTKPRMVVLCGGSGSGKSTITPMVKEKHGWEDFQSVDPDAIMTEFFPEWDELSKQNVLQSAYLAHDEASDIAKMVTRYLINNGYNVIVDGTFSKPKKADELFGYIEDSGIEYESSLIAIDVDEAVSVKSCQDRFVNTGRLVPESVAKASNRGAFDVSRNMGILSRFDTVDTYYRDGDNITEVASKETKDGDVIVRNKEHWKTKKAYVDEEEEMSKMRKEKESKVVKNHVGTIGVGKSKWGFDSPVDMASYGASKGIEIGYRGPFKDEGEEEYLEGVGFTPRMDPNNFLIIMDSYDGSSGVALYSNNIRGPPRYYLDALDAMIPDSEWKEYLPTIRDWIDLVADVYSNIDPSMIKSRTKKAHRFQIYQFDRDQLRNDEDVRDVWRNALLGWDYFAERYPDEKPWDKYSQTYEYDDDDENLEEVFYRFNEKRPEDFRGYSLSVGDIVVRDGQAYMVDTFGFTPVDFVHKSRTEKGRRENLAQMSGILRQMRDLAHRLVSLDADYGTYNTEELLEDIDNMIYWIERERDDPAVKSKDKIDPSNPESIRKDIPSDYLSREDYATILSMQNYLDTVERNIRDKIESIRSMAYTLGDAPGLMGLVGNVYKFEDVDILSKLESAMTTIRDYGNAIYSMNDPTDSAFSDVRRVINEFIWGQEVKRDSTEAMDVPVEDADYDLSQYEIKAKKGKVRESDVKIDPSDPVSLRKGMMRKCGCGGKMEKEDESPEEPTQEAPQQTTEEDDVSDTSDEEKPVETEDEPKEEVEKSVPMLKDPGQMFKACYEYQESRRLNGLYSDEISKVCGGVDPQTVIGYHSGSGAVQRIRCSDGYIYRFNGQNMRRL